MFSLEMFCLANSHSVELKKQGDVPSDLTGFLITRKLVQCFFKVASILLIFNPPRKSEQREVHNNVQILLLWAMEN